MDPFQRSLFKVKTFSLGCPNYNDFAPFDPMRINETSTPPYAFERGDHRVKAPVLGEDPSTIDWSAYMPCVNAFFDRILVQDWPDVSLAYERSGATDCGSFLIDAGLIDRDLGNRESEPAMEQFINDNLGSNTCDEGCKNSNLASQVDIENFLKMFAVYASIISTDSPMGNGNNYYLAGTGDGSGYKIFPYDHGSAGAMCPGQTCDTPLIYWSIIRPTCASLESNQIVGPLLTNKTLHGQYLNYVGSFVNSVMGNSSFIDSLESHIKMIESDVREDYWSSPGSFDIELSTNAMDWDREAASLPWIPFLKAREAEIRIQLDAIDAGTFPRGPHLEVGVEPQELCVDWRSTEPFKKECFLGCKYEGCHETGWIVPSFCDVNSGVCSHGNAEPKCANVPDGGRYEGMERDILGVCWNVEGTPTLMSDCPSPKLCSQDDDCLYDGCNVEGLFVRCEPTNGLCYQAEVDDKCSDMPDMEQYEGMESRDDRPTFCFDLEGTPMKVSECPPKGIITPGCQSDDDCNYDGCLMEGWTLEKSCNLDNGLCYHGDADTRCSGLNDLDRYEGMENRDDGRYTFCFNVAGTPTSVSECPPRPPEETSSPITSTTNTSSDASTTPDSTPVSESSLADESTGRQSSHVHIIVVPILVGIEALLLFY